MLLVLTPYNNIQKLFVASLLKNKECEASVNNRACRIIGNLALNAATCSQIHEEDKLIETIVQLLATSSDEALQLTTLKTLKYVSFSVFHLVIVLLLNNLVMERLAKRRSEVLLRTEFWAIHSITRWPLYKRAYWLLLPSVCLYQVTMLCTVHCKFCNITCRLRSKLLQLILQYLRIISEITCQCQICASCCTGIRRWRRIVQCDWVTVEL